MPELVQPPLYVNAKCDVVMKLSVFRTQTDTHTHTRQNLYILALQAVITCMIVVLWHSCISIKTVILFLKFPNYASPRGFGGTVHSAHYN